MAFLPFLIGSFCALYDFWVFLRPGLFLRFDDIAQLVFKSFLRLGGAEGLLWGKDVLFLVSIAEMILHEKNGKNRIYVARLCLFFQQTLQNFVHFFYEVAAFLGQIRALNAVCPLPNLRSVDLKGGSEIGDAGLGSITSAKFEVIADSLSDLFGVSHVRLWPAEYFHGVIDKDAVIFHADFECLVGASVFVF